MSGDGAAAGPPTAGWRRYLSWSWAWLTSNMAPTSSRVAVQLAGSAVGWILGIDHCGGSIAVSDDRWRPGGKRPEEPGETHMVADPDEVVVLDPPSCADRGRRWPTRRCSRPAASRCSTSRPGRRAPGSTHPSHHPTARNGPACPPGATSRAPGTLETNRGALPAEIDQENEPYCGHHRTTGGFGSDVPESVDSGGRRYTSLQFEIT